MSQISRVGDEPVPGFTLRSQLGSGNFGCVWLADAPGGGQVAVKIVDLQRTYGQKELRSLRLVNRIRHPNIVPLVGFWLRDRDGNLIDAASSDDVVPNVKETLRAPDSGEVVAVELIIIMGLGDMSLHQRLQQCHESTGKGIPIDELLDYMHDAARAIDFLNSPRHESISGPVGIQHCDIKPQNILIVGGAAQICDLGLARILDDARATRAAFTAAYGAPECLRGSSPTQGTDQYSLAVSYVELRTGSLPFKNVSSPAEVIRAHLESRLELSRLSAGERQVIRRATSLEPGDRYESACDMVEALRENIYGSSASRTGTERAPAKSTSRSERTKITIQQATENAIVRNSASRKSKPKSAMSQFKHSELWILCSSVAALVVLAGLVWIWLFRTNEVSDAKPTATAEVKRQSQPPVETDSPNPGKVEQFKRKDRSASNVFDADTNEEKTDSTPPERERIIDKHNSSENKQNAAEPVESKEVNDKDPKIVEATDVDISTPPPADSKESDSRDSDSAITEKHNETPPERKRFPVSPYERLEPGKRALALVELNRKINRDSTNLQNYIDRAFVELQLGLYEEALADRSHVVFHDPARQFDLTMVTINDVSVHSVDDKESTDIKQGQSLILIQTGRIDDRLQVMIKGGPNMSYWIRPSDVGAQ